MRKNLPNVFTLFNLLSGCLSIIFLFSGDVALASWMIGIAAILDFLDGMLARLLKASSEFGKVLDSLADVVSFGVAPGFIIFRMIQVWGDGPELLAYIALLVPALSAVRLAVFSVDQRQQYHFIGVPTPLNALMLASIPLILMQYANDSVIHAIFTNQWFLVALSVISSLMLVMPVRIMALKFKTFGWKENQKTYLLAMIFIIMAILFGFLAMPVIYVVYLVFSIIDTQLNQS